MSAPVDVVVVAEADDRHALAVRAELANSGASTARLNLTDLRNTPIGAEAGSFEFSTDGSAFRASNQTTVWWRRLGQFNVSELDGDEVRLAQDEAPEIMRGALLAAGVRWVDEPFAVDRAETKQYQLAIARQCGIRVPHSLVTNDPSAAREFAIGRELIAKPLSSGVGIAPYVARVEYDDLARVAAMPTLLQELVYASADLRVVVVGAHVWAWRRVREEGVIDWRSVAPDGSGFDPIDAGALAGPAREVTRSLGLTMSVQDFLDTADGPVFLEANPQGSWLFLIGANDLVVPELAKHLWGSMRNESKGEWPSLRSRVLNDFRSKQRAPGSDGVVGPTFDTPDWINEAATRQGVIDVARRANDEAKDAAKAAEEKAARLVQVALALMTVTLGLGAFQLKFALDRSYVWLWTLIPIGVALACLALSAVEALQIDRVGFYRTAQVADLVQPGVAPEAAIVDAEERGRKLARWTANNKHTDLMQARAWFSRGLVALLAAAILGAGLRAATPGSSHPSTKTNPASSASVATTVAKP